MSLKTNRRKNMKNIKKWKNQNYVLSIPIFLREFVKRRLKKIKDTTYERLGLRSNNDKDIVQFKKDMKECQDKLLYELLKTFPMLCFLID